MSYDMVPDKLVAKITVAHLSASECGIQEDMDSKYIKIVGRRKAMKFVFAHLIDGGMCLTQKVVLEGGHKGIILFLWSMREKIEEEESE